jgi:hypothetical protein
MREIDAFIDHGFDDPSVFSKQFFASSDFTTTTLRKILRTGTTKNKEELAGAIWRRLEQDELDPYVILRHWAAQPRRWLSFRLGVPAGTPTVGSVASILTQFGEEGWHGPVPDPTGSHVWYIRTKKFPHYRLVNNQPRLSFVRWSIMAQVSQRHVALCWNNFTHRPTNTIEERDRNPFWQFIPEMFSELERLLGGKKWRSPVLNELVLHDLWDRYRSDPEYRWLHLRIRAERYGVALSARSAGITEVDVAGLEALTRSLARSAAKGANVTDTRLIEQMEAELLRALLREWGANSYAFQLDRLVDGDPPTETLFKGHCYFGLRKNLHSQDRFPHIECYQESGGSTGALKFLLSNL